MIRFWKKKQSRPEVHWPAPICPMWIIGFAGRRTGIDEQSLGPIIEGELRALYEWARTVNGSLHFYSSVTDGADLLALDCAERLDLPLHVVLPVPEREFSTGRLDPD